MSGGKKRAAEDDTDDTYKSLLKKLRINRLEHSVLLKKQQVLKASTLRLKGLQQDLEVLQQAAASAQ